MSALLFVAAVALTIVWCASMTSMAGMPMPGGWTMSMTWMRMPGHSWPGSAASFIVMWTVMMVAMMLPSITPALVRYRAAVATSGRRVDLLTAIATAAYFLVWALAGVVAFAAGVTVGAIEMQSATVSCAVPIAAALIVVIAGSLQFTPWKARQLSRCCETPRRALAPTAFAAFRHGTGLGIRCASCCANLTLLLLVIGVMDLRAMAVVAAAITAERLSPSGVRAARVTGVVIVAGGAMLMVAAVGRMPLGFTRC